MVTITFHGNLKELLAAGYRDTGVVSFNLDRLASIKDVVEAYGVPHPEITRITVNGLEVDFAWLAGPDDRIDVEPIAPPFDVLSPSRLRPHPLPDIRFAVDVNVGKLASLLRLLGFDTLYQKYLPDAELAKAAVSEARILLTRDRRLLKRKIITFGHLIRAIDPVEQLQETVNLFQAAALIRPFSRCLRCNGILIEVAKDEIIHRLETLTIKYYHLFYTCRGCGQIYWQGSHQENMRNLLKRLHLGQE